MTKHVYEIDYENNDQKNLNNQKIVKFKKQAPECHEKQGWMLHKNLLSKEERKDVTFIKVSCLK